MSDDSCPVFLFVPCTAFDSVRMLSWLYHLISDYCVAIILALVLISYLWWNVLVEELMTSGGWVLLHTMHQHYFFLVCSVAESSLLIHYSEVTYVAVQVRTF